MNYYDNYNSRNFSFSPYGRSGNGVKWLVIANIAVFLAQLITADTLINIFGLVPGNITSRFYLWQLVTYMFLHGGFFHIFMNMFILWMFGKIMEDAWGTASFLKYYFTCGIGAGLFIVLFSPRSYIPNVGASGAIYGLLLAFGVTYPNEIIYLYFFFPLKAKYMVLLLGAIAFFSGISSTGSNIAHFGHLGGLLVGYVYLKFPVIRYKIRYPSVFINEFIVSSRNILNKALGKRKTRRTLDPADLEHEANCILDKIMLRGINSLTRDEKKILDDYVANKKDKVFH